MSEFDDLIAKRLDEEANFPNRGKSWKQMSKRLDAFDSGAVQGHRPRLRGWQGATVAAVAVAGFLLWKTIATQRENTKLHQDIASLQTEQANLADQLATAEKTLARTPAGMVPEQETTDGNKKLQSDGTLKTESSQLKGTDAGKQANGTIKTAEKIKSPVAPALEQKTEMVQKTTGNSIEKPEEKAAENLTEKQAVVVAVEEKSSNPVENHTSENPKSMDSLSTETPSLASVEPSLDSLKVVPPQKDSLLAVIEKNKDTIASIVSPASEIKPQHKSRNRFRIGTQGTIGFVQPKQKGVSTLKGQGFNLEARIFKSLWATASIDWLHHEVSTEEFVPRFHPHHDSLPEPPNSGGGGLHPSKLVLVESAPREQRFGLGLRYTIPVHFWVRPSVRVAHEWVRVSPTMVTYKFEEEDPGGPGPGWHDHDPEYTAEKFEAQWLQNQWRFGIGLEKDIPNWTFGLWADYSKDFSASTPSFDALYVRAGAQFRF